MVVAVGTYEMGIFEAHSLKEKRRVIRSTLDRVRAKFNASIAEVANNDSWQKATLGVAVVANDRVFLQKVAAKIDNIIEDNSEAEIIDSYWDYI